MAPPLLTLKDIHLTFGGTPLLEGAELTVAARDRICLVGRNGSGKSTLLKIAAALAEPDRGERFAHPGASIRYLPQEADFAGFNTVRAYVEAGLGPTDDPYAAEYLISELGLSGDDDPERLSGGEARRVALARVLVAKPDVLLLDEPTNHLDLTAIEWLEATLQATRSALLLISHDRRFLEISRAQPFGSIAVRRGVSNRASRLSKTGATRFSRRKKASATSSTAKSFAKINGCTAASPGDASATCAACGNFAPCARKCASSDAPSAASALMRQKAGFPANSLSKRPMWRRATAGTISSRA